jgi:hypothetical protein
VARFLSRESTDDNGGHQGSSAAPGEWLRGFPALCEFLCLCQWDDGTPRLSSTLLLFVEGGRWSVCLNDREQSRSAWASGASEVEALSSLDSALQDGTANWRVSGQRNARKKGT